MSKLVPLVACVLLSGCANTQFWQDAHDGIEHFKTQTHLGGFIDAGGWRCGVYNGYSVCEDSAGNLNASAM